MSLGTRPTEPDGQHPWDTAAHAIESYRAANDIAELDRPLGGPPAEPAARATYQHALRELLAARRSLRAARPAPDTRSLTGGVTRDIA